MIGWIEAGPINGILNPIWFVTLIFICEYGSGILQMTLLVYLLLGYRVILLRFNVCRSLHTNNNIRVHCVSWLQFKPIFERELYSELNIYILVIYLWSFAAIFLFVFLFQWLRPDVEGIKFFILRYDWINV